MRSQGFHHMLARIAAPALVLFLAAQFVAFARSLQRAAYVNPLQCIPGSHIASAIVHNATLLLICSQAVVIDHAHPVVVNSPCKTIAM